MNLPFNMQSESSACFISAELKQKKILKLKKKEKKIEIQKMKKKNSALIIIMTAFC